MVTVKKSNRKSSSLNLLAARITFFAVEHDQKETIKFVQNGRGKKKKKNIYFPPIQVYWLLG